MRNNVSTLFYLKKPKNYSSGEMPVYLRITVEGIRKDFTSGKSCEPAKWDAKANRMIGYKEEIKAFNNYLFSIEKKIDRIQTDLVLEGKEVSAEAIKNKFFGVEEIQHNLLIAFQDHNDRIEALVGKDFSRATLVKYNTTFKHVKAFIKRKYRLNDVLASKVDYAFITDLDFFLRTECHCANNTAVKHLKNLAKVIRICLANRWIRHDPFLSHKNKIKRVERAALDMDELLLISTREFSIERLQVVRDAFVFCCYTGLSFIDVQQLKKSEISEGVDGCVWIMKKRQKTKVATHIPLLPIPLKIIEKYKEHPMVEDRDRVLPIASNQKMNAYLKEVADLCGIKKHLTFHIARHTFATTVTLSKGIPIESVSKMLGHTDIRTTQIYAKMMDVKVANDMSALRDVFS